MAGNEFAIGKKQRKLTIQKGTKVDQNVGKGGLAIAEAVKELYQEGETDYFMKPIVLVNDMGEPVGTIKDGDSVIFCCHRGEREIQLTRAFMDPSFKEFPRKEFKGITFVIMTFYHKIFTGIPVAFLPIKLKDTLGEVVSMYGQKQLRIAESEKFAHVTFFFNGRNDQPFPREVDVHVPSPEGVPFDQIPELNVAGVAEKAVEGIREGKFDLIVVNFANGDVVGHLANMNARIECAGAVDKHLGMVLEVAAEVGYVVVITADHGVLEETVKPDRTVNMSHTANPVPFIVFDPITNSSSKPTLASMVVRPYKLKEWGKLGNVAPTVLEIMGLPKPETMTCESLLADYPKTEGKRKVLLVVLDGWGIGRDDETNPIFAGHTPVWDVLRTKCPFAQLRASGEDVGLKPDKMGNSEAGHMNMSAGRVVQQDDMRIELALKDNSFYENEAFLKAIRNAKEKKSALHLLALLSKNSSHGSVDYPLALLRLAKEQGLKEIYVHIIFDGRSTDPGTAPMLLEEFESEMKKIGIGEIVSGMGRGIALDRNKDYRGKTKLAYDALVFGRGKAVRATL